MRGRGSWAGVLVLGLGAGCGPAEPAVDPTPSEALDACGLGQSCGTAVVWDECANNDDYAYNEFHACTYAALAGVEPGPIKMAFVYAPEPCISGDYSNPHADRITIHRWSDGGMSCLVKDSVGEQVYACSWGPDAAALFETCLAAAEAEAFVTEDCLNWHTWPLVLGDPIEPVCGS